MHHEFPNTRRVDWNTVAAGWPALFGKAGFTQTLKGMIAFSERITLANAGAPLQDPAVAGGKSRRASHDALGLDVKGTDAKHALPGG